jgi:4-methylaminobutanoate oxidase (formaldehyde-forming)
VDRTREIYGKHYTIHWPGEEHDSARGVRRSPLYYLLKEKGAVYGAKYGWERVNWFAPEGVKAEDERTFGIPNWFAHVAGEHRAVRQHVALIDQSSFCKFTVKGPGALTFLNRLCANQIDQPVGKIIYTQMCNEKGTIECDMTIARQSMNQFLIVVGTAFGRRVDWWLNRHAPQDGTVAIVEVTSAFAVVNAAGPNSRALLQKVSDSDVSNNGFPFGTCKEITVGYAPVTAFRITYVGELGYELYIPSEFAGHVYETLWAAGQDLGIVNAGYRVIASTRLEKGYADWGSELSPEYSPYDAGLGFCVDLGKDDFIGKSALARIKDKGSEWRLCSFTIDTEKPVMVQSSAPILFEGQVLGVATSAGYGHTIGKTICFGYIPAGHTEFDQGFSIEIYKEIHPATCHPRRALYDPERKKILC